MDISAVGISDLAAFFDILNNSDGNSRLLVSE